MFPVGRSRALLRRGAILFGSWSGLLVAGTRTDWDFRFHFRWCCVILLGRPSLAIFVGFGGCKIIVGGDSSALRFLLSKNTLDDDEESIPLLTYTAFFLGVVLVAGFFCLSWH